MKRRFISPLLLLFLFSLVLLKTPPQVVLGYRGLIASVLSPLWKGGETLSKGLSSPISQNSHFQNLELQEQVKQLSLENALLKEEVLKLSSVSLEKMSQLFPLESFEKSQEEGELEKMKSQSLMARVIYRPPTTWSSSLWINLGEDHNKGGQVVAQNSPVTSGDSLVGVIDYVGRSVSRVRLLTDSSMTLPVRACRGKKLSRFLADKLRELQLFCASDLQNLLSQEEKQKLFSLSDQLVEKLHKQTQSLYLAKGELKGKALPFWQAYHQKLEGTGFNYDFPDDPLAAPPEEAIIEKGDLLITSGLDGCLPPGLRVAIVSSLTPPKEGAYFIELQALPCAGSLNELTTLSVLPPLNYSNLEQSSENL